MNKTLTAALAAVSLALVTTGCSSSSLQQAAGGGTSPATAGAAATSQSATSAAVAPVTADPALKAKLPKRVQDSGTILVGVDATYAPNEFLESDGKTVTGWDVELFNAVAQRMGVKAEWQVAQFDTILNGIASNKYDAAVSSFTINKERLNAVNMVSYLNAGTQWVVQKGNPKQVDVSDRSKLCGKTVVVQKGTVQNDEMTAVQGKCAPDKKMNLMVFDDQGMVTNAIMTGRADAMAADSPIALGAVKANPDKIEAAGDVYDSAPYGFVTSKQNKDFADAIAQATKDIKASGQYDAILAKWGQGKGAVTDIQVNPTVNS